MIKITLLLVMTLLGSLGGFFFKRCTSQGLKISKFFILNLGIGGILYVAGALLNIWLLKLMPYTIVYPLTSITYIWTLIISYYFLSEKLNLRKVTGLLLIVLGACILVF